MMGTGAGANGQHSTASPDRDAAHGTYSGGQQQGGEPWDGLGPGVKLLPWRPAQGLVGWVRLGEATVGQGR